MAFAAAGALLWAVLVDKVPFLANVVLFARCNMASALPIYWLWPPIMVDVVWNLDPEF